HAIERAVILNTDPVLRPEAFDQSRFGLTAVGPASHDTSGTPALGQAGTPTTGEAGLPVVLNTLNIAEAETLLIERALAITDNNRTRAAELLGISVRTLRNKLNAGVG